MEMGLKRLILVLLTALGVSGQAPVILDDQQRREERPLGSSVTFHCCLTTPPEYDRLRVVFFLYPDSFNNSYKLPNKIVYNSTKNSSSAVLNQTKRDSGHEGQDCAEAWRTFTLLNATERDSGWYFCNVTVEIPILNITNSSGTEVVITKSKEHTTYPSLPIVTGEQAPVPPADSFSLIDWWLWITLGVSAVVLIVLLVLCVLLRRQRRRRSRGEEPIYTNTRPVNKQPSPRPGPGAGHLKAGSSSQNLRNQSPGGTWGEDQCRYK